MMLVQNGTAKFSYHMVSPKQDASMVVVQTRTLLYEPEHSVPSLLLKSIHIE